MKLPNRYTLSGTNNTGGMGDIYYCTDTHLQREVVIKLLKANEEQRRLFDEQKCLIQLRSKHVVQLYDVVDIEGRIGLVLEFIDGNDLQISECSGNETKLLETLWQVSCGLADIHKSGIIHRDIKPNNIRRANTGVVKVFDFGLSRKLDSAKTHSVIGTVGYMAPELWQRGQVVFTTAIDVYAFGVTALALAGVNAPDALFQYPPLPAGNGWLQAELPNLDSAIVSIIEQCLSHSPQNRPSISKVEGLLRRYLLKDRHKGLLVMGTQVKELNGTNRSSKISFGSTGNIKGEITIKYDGFDFNVVALRGDVTINNIIVNVGDLLPEASVITLGSGSGSRGFVTFDISNPEVVS